MLTRDVIAVYGTQTALANALGISRSAVSQWGREVPLLRQYQIERLTGGRLRVRAPRPRRSR